MKINRFLLVVFALLMLCFGCASAEDISIVCTSFPCYDFARAVASCDENIRLLIKPGAEVHSYEPTPADIMALADCDLFVYIGGESDAWVEDILASFGDDAPATLRLMECVETAAHVDDHHHGEKYDEHIWTSPVNAQKMVRAMEEKLSGIDIENAEAYSANADEYCGQIAEIDAEIRAVVDTCARRELVFADRFPFIYMANEYGLDYVSAFASCSAESEPSAKTMAMLIEKVAFENIPVVYTIELSTQKTARAIAEETGAEIVMLHSIQTLSEADFASGESYVSLMNKNVEALRKGLN